MNNTHSWALRKKLGLTQGGYAEGGITQIVGELKHGTVSTASTARRNRSSETNRRRAFAARVWSHFPSLTQNAACLILRQLKLNMQTQRRYQNRPPVAVIAGIVDMLQSERGIDSAPCVECVV